MQRNIDFATEVRMYLGTGHEIFSDWTIESIRVGNEPPQYTALRLIGMWRDSRR